jgi:hypothetical protein
MEISDSASRIGPAVGIAVQSKMLDQMKTQGADIVDLIAHAAVGSTNSPGQGHFIDARA